MVETKSLEQTRKRWEAAHGRVPGAYKEGIQAAKDWQGPAIAAEELWAAKVAEAAAAKRRARRIAEVTNEQWKTAAAEKGSARIGPGMAAAKEKYAKGMAAVLETIRNVSLPPRTTDPMANIDNRVKPIVAALKKLKE